MRLIFILIFITTFQATHASDTIIARFINAVYGNVVDTSFAYYNLYSTGKCFALDGANFQKINDELKDDRIAAFLHSIMLKSGEKCNDINWSSFHLNKAKIFEGSHEKFAPPEVIVVSSRLSKKKQKIEFERQDSIIKNWRKEDYSYFYFSKPVFQMIKSMR